MRRMHKPDPKLGPDEQDKRMVVVLHDDAQEVWLRGSVDEAEQVVGQWPAEKFSAGPLIEGPRALDPVTGELF